MIWTMLMFMCTAGGCTSQLVPFATKEACVANQAAIGEKFNSMKTVFVYLNCIETKE